MSDSAKQRVMDKIKKFGGHVSVTRTDTEFIVEAFAPDDHYWVGDGAGPGKHSLIASCPKGTFTMTAWQQIHTAMKHGVAHCGLHHTKSKECEWDHEAHFENIKDSYDSKYESKRRIA